MKRMLAYSSVAHTGYILAASDVAAPGGRVARRRCATRAAAAMYYLFVYTFMTLGAFAFLIYAGRGDKDAEDIGDFAGLAKRKPWAALAMTVFMVSLAGIPPTAGFFGKFLLFKAMVAAGVSAGDHRRAELGGVALLLPARGRVHVHEARAGGVGDAAGWASTPRWWSLPARPSRWRWASCPRATSSSPSSRFSRCCGRLPLSLPLSKKRRLRSIFASDSRLFLATISVRKTPPTMAVLVPHQGARAEWGRQIRDTLQYSLFCAISLFQISPEPLVYLGSIRQREDVIAAPN